MNVKDIIEERINNQGGCIYIPYYQTGAKAIKGYHWHHPFYKSKGYPLFIPKTHDKTKNIFDLVILVTPKEHILFEQLSKLEYGIITNLTEYGLIILQNLKTNINIKNIIKLYKENLEKKKNAYIKYLKSEADKYGINYSNITIDELKHQLMLSKVLSSEAAQKRCRDPKYIERLSKSAIKVGKDPNIRKQRSENAKKQWKDPKFINLIKETASNNWKDPIIKEKMLLGMKNTMFTSERVSELNKKRTGLVAYHNTKIQIRIKPTDPIPEGFIPGYLWVYNKNKNK